MFCSLPHSHLLVGERPQACSVCRHLPWPTRNLLRVFQIGHGWLSLLARHSTGMIPLASQELAPAPKAFHLSSQRVSIKAFLDVLMACVVSIKLFLDLRCFIGFWWEKSRCLASISAVVRSSLLIAVLLMSGGAIPAKAGCGSSFYTATDYPPCFIERCFNFLCMAWSTPGRARIFCIVPELIL